MKACNYLLFGVFLSIWPPKLTEMLSEDSPSVRLSVQLKLQVA